MLPQLADDPDPSVKNGAELLDRLIKDIVTEKPAFDVDEFIPLLAERIHTIKPHVRQVWLRMAGNGMQQRAVSCQLDIRAGLGAGH